MAGDRGMDKEDVVHIYNRILLSLKKEWHNAIWVKWMNLMGLEMIDHVPSRWLSSEESTCNAENEGLISGSGRSPEGGNGNPLQYSCQDNPTDREAWRATVHGATKESNTIYRLYKNNGDDHTKWNQKEKDTLLICGILKNGTNECIYKIEIVIDIENSY